MSEESYLLDKKEKRWMPRLMKFIFFTVAFLLIGVTILGNMGGSNDDLKSSVEQFVSGVFKGKATKVEKLVYMSFFPRIGFDAEGINVLSKPEGGYSIIRVGKAQVFMGFWNVATRTPKFTHFYMEDFKAIKGALGPKEFYIEKIFVDHDAEALTAQLRGNGKIGVHPWSFAIDLDIYGSKGSYSYMLRREMPLVFDVADIHFEGTFINHESNYYKLEDFKLSSGNKFLSGNLVLSALGQRLLKLKGSVQMSGGNSVISPDVIFDYAQIPVKISGDISSDNMLFSDLIGEDSAFSVFERLRNITGIGGVNALVEHGVSFIGKYNLNVDFNLKNVKIVDSTVENLKFPIIQTSEGVKVGPIESNSIVMPSLLFVPQEKTGEIIAILQEGALNLSPLKELLSYVPKEFMEPVDIECAIAVLTHDDQNLMVKSYDINKGIGSFEFEKGGYDFIQASLQSSSEISPCSSYISRSPVTVEEQAVESSEKQE